jgi:hypothetical protein
MRDDAEQDGERFSMEYVSRRILEKVRYAAQEYLLTHFGELVTCGEPKFDPSECTYSLTLGYRCSISLEFGGPKLVTIDSIGTLTLDAETMKVVEEFTTPRNTLLETLKKVIRRLAKK